METGNKDSLKYSVNWNINKQVVELRYPKAVLFWDKAGILTKTICDQFPEYEVESASPETVKLNSSLKPITISIGFERLSVTALMANVSAAHYSEVTSFVVALLTKTIGISQLSRVGHRTFYNASCESLDQAKKNVQRIAKNCDFGKSFLESSEDDRLKSKEIHDVTLKLVDEKTGLTLHLSATTEKVEVQGNPGSFALNLPPPKHSVTLDVDVFTRAMMPVALFAADEYVHSNIKLVETRIIPRLSNKP